MKVRRVARDVVWELMSGDLKNEARLRHVAVHASIGDLIYAPELLPAFAIAEKIRGKSLAGDAVEHDPDHLEPVKPSKPDPHRVDLLRVALRARGRELFDEGAYYFRIVQR